ncbi:MAG: hypothetical protein ACKOBZ_00385 [Nitrospira sp.]|nr:hypothetical protein [Nitrospira sp.]
MSPVKTLLEAQLKELDAIEKETATQNMNTMRGLEFVHAWKVQAVALISQHVSPQAAKRLADAKPGPSFTNDLFEEFADEVDVYRQAVRAVMKELP